MRVTILHARTQHFQFAHALGIVPDRHARHDLNRAFSLQDILPLFSVMAGKDVFPLWDKLFLKCITTHEQRNKKFREKPKKQACRACQPCAACQYRCGISKNKKRADGNRHARHALFCYYSQYNPELRTPHSELLTPNSSPVPFMGTPNS